MKAITFALLAALVADPVSAQQYPTIVGEWYVEEYGAKDCGTQFSVQIGPMMVAEETYICRFDDVRRDGWQVTWNGSCSDGSTVEKMNLVAIENDGRLSLWYNGTLSDATLRRCNATPAAHAVPPPVERIPLEYVTYGADSDAARVYWPDAIQDLLMVGEDPNAKLRIYVASAGGYEFVSAESMFHCGMGWECPVKIVKDGLVVGEFNTCTERDQHALAADGTRFFACETGGQGRPMSTLMR